MDVKNPLFLSTIVILGAVFTIGKVEAGEVHTSGGNFSGNATPTEYIITVNAIEFHRVGDNDNTYQSFVNKSTNWDIASANPGAALGSVNATNPLPVGTYDKIRFTVSKTMTIKGAISSLSDSSPCRTDAAGTTVSNPFGEGVLDTAYLGSRDGGTATAETVTVPSGSDVDPPSGMTDLGSSFRGTLTLASPFAVSTIVPAITIKFDVSNAMQFVLLPDRSGRCVVFPGPPSIAVQVS